MTSLPRSIFSSTARTSRASSASVMRTVAILSIIAALLAPRRLRLRARRATRLWLLHRLERLAVVSRSEPDEWPYGFVSVGEWRLAYKSACFSDRRVRASGGCTGYRRRLLAWCGGTDGRRRVCRSSPHRHARAPNR